MLVGEKLGPLLFRRRATNEDQSALLRWRLVD